MQSVQAVVERILVGAGISHADASTMSRTSPEYALQQLVDYQPSSQLLADLGMNGLNKSALAKRSSFENGFVGCEAVLSDILPWLLTLCNATRAELRLSATVGTGAMITLSLEKSLLPQQEQLRLLKSQMKTDKSTRLEERHETLKSKIASLTRSLTTLLGVLFPKRLLDSSHTIRHAVVRIAGRIGSILKSSSPFGQKYKISGFIDQAIDDKDANVRQAALEVYSDWIAVNPESLPVEKLISLSFDSNKQIQLKAVKLLEELLTENLIDKLGSVVDGLWEVLWDINVSLKTKEVVARLASRFLFSDEGDTLESLVAFATEFAPVQDRKRCVGLSDRVFESFKLLFSPKMRNIHAIIEIAGREQCGDMSLTADHQKVALMLLSWACRNFQDEIDEAVADKVAVLLGKFNSDRVLQCLAGFAALEIFSVRPSVNLAEAAEKRLSETDCVIAMEPLARISIGDLDRIKSETVKKIFKSSSPSMALIGVLRSLEISAGNERAILSDSEFDQLTSVTRKCDSGIQLALILDLLCLVAQKRSENHEISARFFDECHSVFSSDTVSTDVQLFIAARAVGLAGSLGVPIPYLEEIKRVLQAVTRQPVEDCADEMLPATDLPLGTRAFASWASDCLFLTGFSAQGRAVLARVVSKELRQ